MEYYAGQRGVSARVEGLSEGLATPPGGGRLFVVEMTANVRPAAEDLKRIEGRAERAAVFPLRVRWLEYGIVVYAERPGGGVPAGGTP